MKNYFEVKENRNGITHIKCEVYYSLGGYNVWTGKQEPRGYYASVSPVERKDYGNGCVMESYVAFTGIKQLLKEVSRKSVKSQAEAEKMAENVFNSLIEYIMNEHGIELAVSPIGGTSGTVESVA